MLCLQGKWAAELKNKTQNSTVIKKTENTLSPKGFTIITSLKVASRVTAYKIKSLDNYAQPENAMIVE